MQEGRIVRSDEITKEERERIITEDLACLVEMPDADIDHSDIPRTTPEQWAQAPPNRFYRPVKDQVTLRLDRYVLEWFRDNHEKYQTAINAALMEHIRRERGAKSDQ